MFPVFQNKILSLGNGEILHSCTSHNDSWVTDLAFGGARKQLVSVGNNIQVCAAFLLFLCL